MSSDYFCSRHMDKAKRVSWKVLTCAGHTIPYYTMVGLVSLYDRARQAAARVVVGCVGQPTS